MRVEKEQAEIDKNKMGFESRLWKSVEKRDLVLKIETEKSVAEPNELYSKRQKYSELVKSTHPVKIDKKKRDEIKKLMEVQKTHMVYQKEYYDIKKDCKKRISRKKDFANQSIVLSL